jgi:hypothetical protein
MKKQFDYLLRALGLVALLLITITVFNRSKAAVARDTMPNLYLHKIAGAQTFFSGWDVLGWTAAGVGGYTMGLREAFHADPTIFERKWGKSPLSFWGSEGWRRKYYDNDPTRGKKSEFLGNAQRDFWHAADKVQRAGLIVGLTVPLVQTKRPLRQRLLNAGVSALVYSFCYTRGYNFRYQ